MQVTIAGVPARTIIDMDGESPVYLTREEELAGITADTKRKNNNIEISDPYKALDRLTENLIFYTNTGTTCNYRSITKPAIISIDGHEIQTAGGAIISKLDSKAVKNLDLDEDIDFTPIEGGLS